MQMDAIDDRVPRPRLSRAIRFGQGDDMDVHARIRQRFRLTADAWVAQVMGMSKHCDPRRSHHLIAHIA
jgi:hypothetical protein